MNPEIVWSPPPELLERSEMAQLAAAVGAGDYQELWRWSVADVERFWRLLWDRYEIVADGDPSAVLGSRQMPGARWFPDTALSYPEHVFRGKDESALAVQFATEAEPLASWSWGELRQRTAAVRAGLRQMGVGRGDRVAAYLPNTPWTLAAFLATTSLGATWSSCSPDFGARTVVDRFSQIEPRVLLAVDGYDFGGRRFDRSEEVAGLEAALPSLERTVRIAASDPDASWRSAFPATGEPLEFERVPFDHPLWIVYSSGTTGAPKAIVHGHGGPLLEHLKIWRLHHALQPGDRVLWTTTTGWIMWNYLAGALLSPASIVLYEGSLTAPSREALWDLAAAAEVNVLGTGAAYIHSCMSAEVHPAAGRDLGSLRAVGSTGSPLAPEAYSWVRAELGPEVWLSSASGGTDIASAFIAGCPTVPVYKGELQARCLGVDVQAWDESGDEVREAVGELVVAQPMPSMPVGFWNDPGDERYRDSYFSTFPGVWRHGDWLRITERGSAVIYGRSDSTINRAGIRMGTAEIYAAVLAAPEIEDALVVDVPPEGGLGNSWMALFVVVREGEELTEELSQELRRRIKSDCSPRHAPDAIVAVAEVPRTLTGKLLEVPVKKLLMGWDPDGVANRDALANPAAFDWFVDYARRRAAGGER
ncbi:MAG TPA: acetoacetate--CoA ligase [Solirubrobacterales bacterium]|jgi:acetoacetyl-CoA synthetase